MCLVHFALILYEFRRGRVHARAFLTYVVNRPSKRVNEDHPIILRGCEALDPLDVLVRVPLRERPIAELGHECLIEGREP